MKKNLLLGLLCLPLLLGGCGFYRYKLDNRDKTASPVDAYEQWEVKMPESFLTAEVVDELLAGKTTRHQGDKFPLINIYPIDGFALNEKSIGNTFEFSKWFKPDSWNSYYSYNYSLYSVLREDKDTYSIFHLYKDRDELYSQEMAIGAEGPVIDARVVNGMIAFTFRLGREEDYSNIRDNIFYNGEPFNEKYGFAGTHGLFSYGGKLGFIARKGETEFIYFNDQKITSDFARIPDHGCCEMKYFKPEIYSNGVLLLWGIGSDGVSYFAEVDLNKYTD